ncbi:Uncharacterised protein [Yersinia pekkanenii]|uniref:Uncharacterized protein n=1 Tax=Yersinia pekkanenii TaxID=1288385 RepID=A0ABM9TW56_9GAMM|nr:Uncharacterised protein [Yersinia pekkanenii]
MADALAVEVSVFMLLAVFTIEEAVSNGFAPPFSLLLVLNRAAQMSVTRFIDNPLAGALSIDAHRRTAFSINQLHQGAIIDTVGAQHGSSKVIVIAKIGQNGFVLLLCGKQTGIDTGG